MKRINCFLFVALLIALENLGDVESKKMNKDELMQMMKPFRKRCSASTKVPDDILDNATQGIFTPDPRFQCYIKCVLGCLGCVKNDEYHLDVMKTNSVKMLEPELAERVGKATDACIETMTSSDSCEQAYQFATCYYNFDSSVYVIP